MDWFLLKIFQTFKPFTIYNIWPENVVMSQLRFGEQTNKFVTVGNMLNEGGFCLFQIPRDSYDSESETETNNLTTACVHITLHN